MMKRMMMATLIGVALGGSVLSAKTIATVNGYPITQKEADAFVKKVTKGKATYSMLKKEDRKRVIKELATEKLLTRLAAKELSRKGFIMTNYQCRFIHFLNNICHRKSFT